MVAMFLLVALHAAPDAAATATATAPHVRVSLLTEQDVVAPGETFYAGVHFEMDPNWHVYWQYPGDSGQAPSVQWTLPNGIVADDIQWPLPQRIPLSQVMNYGYEHEVLLPVPMHPNKDWADPNATLTAQVHWLVCAELCIPGSATLSTHVVGGSRSHVQGEYQALFEAALQSVPLKQVPPNVGLHAWLGPRYIALQLIAGPAAKAPAHAAFIPNAGLQIDNSADQIVEPFTMQEPVAEALWLKLRRSDQTPDNMPSLAGVMVIQNADGPPIAFNINEKLEPGEADTDPKQTGAGADKSLALVLLFAFGGGLILNLMPCVFPVLSIKVISLAQMSGQDKQRVRWHAWLYTFGVLVSFWALTATLLVLRGLGSGVGWGFQLQSPAFVVSLMALLFLMGLNLLGTFEMGNSLMGVGQGLASREGAAGAFFTGVLATVVATPCTAPFMGAAVGFAMTQPPAICLLVFTALGAGLAFPYLALCYIPAFARMLPRPGAWMVTLRQLMAFSLFGTVVWLLSVFGQQTNLDAVSGVLAGLLLLAMGAWILGRFGHKRRWQAVAVLCMAMGVGVGLMQASAPPPVAAHSATGTFTENDLQWETFSPERLSDLRRQGRTIFMDFTAAWCVSCKVNERLVFGSDEVRQKLKDLHVALLKGDWTSQDPVITQTLASFGRSGVPLYVLYGHDKEAPVVLPEVITPGIVLDELKKLQ